MTNPKETPERLPAATPGPDLEPMEPTSPAFKDQLRAKFEDYKEKLKEELAAPPETPPIIPPWDKGDRKVKDYDCLLEPHEPWWTMKEQLEWWDKQPPPQLRKGSIVPEFKAWMRDVYRKYIPESEDRDFFDEVEQEALDEAGW
ncbi:hypothetical protein H0H92_002371 [Tricholoma furcatifolium]|nr:hypothetical protein H0H92_002371 [Tricholoma furcatifolium]